MRAIDAVTAFMLVLGLGIAIGRVTTSHSEPPEPVTVPPCSCATPGQVANLERDLGRMALRYGAAVEAFARVAEDCVVPGAWMDVGVVPVSDVIRASALTGAPVRD